MSHRYVAVAMDAKEPLCFSHWQITEIVSSNAWKLSSILLCLDSLCGAVSPVPTFLASKSLFPRKFSTPLNMLSKCVTASIHYSVVAPQLLFITIIIIIFSSRTVTQYIDSFAEFITRYMRRKKNGPCVGDWPNCDELHKVGRHRTIRRGFRISEIKLRSSRLLINCATRISCKNS